MMRFLLGCSWLAACSGNAPPPVVPPTLPAASTACYAGITTGMGKKARTIARRIVDPAAGHIVEDVSHDDGGAKGVNSFHVVMKVDGNNFTMTEAGGAFTGSGALVGEPWQWSAWSSTSQISNGGITVESEDELTDAGIMVTKRIMREGKLLATTAATLKPFDCAQWDKTLATLAAPVLDDALCERACTTFATLRYWSRIEPTISALPAKDQATARAQAEATLADKLRAGTPTCASQCMSAGDAVATACMANATTVEQLDACNAGP
ncbi:MAG: hypothetical protein SFX73_15195 [Kofleriaceae bacterium]|nr:hypothetical protein [Kofleriaceae bacterium]